jgi:hypothetical protein
MLVKRRVAIGKSNDTYRRETLKQYVRRHLGIPTHPLGERSSPQTPPINVEHGNINELPPPLEEIAAITSLLRKIKKKATADTLYFRLMEDHPNYHNYVYLSLTDKVSYNHPQFNIAINTFAQIISMFLYNCVFRFRSSDQATFDEALEVNFSVNEILKRVISSYMSNLKLYFNDNTINYIIYKIRLYYYKSVQNHTLPTYNQLSQCLYPSIPNDYFEWDPTVVHTGEQPFVIDVSIITRMLVERQQQQQHHPKLDIQFVIDDTTLPDDSICNVCWDHSSHLTQLITTGCNHVFCTKCISSIANTNTKSKHFISCPCCRATISSIHIPSHIQPFL